METKGCLDSWLTAVFSLSVLCLANEGIEAAYMVPIFPSKTFPNHYTLVTGLYAESHGIVSNTFYDPVLDLTFTISDPVAVTNPAFWGGEPVRSSSSPALSLPLNLNLCFCCLVGWLIQ